MSQIICTFAPNMKRVYAILLLLVAFSMSLWAQEQQMSVAERNAAQGFNDTIDRLAPDFVTVSLVVCDPEEVLYSTLGHAALHLQCPVFNLDYIFSYEGENVQDKIWTFLKGGLKMGMFAIPADEFLKVYQDTGRGVKEYTINLSPEQEQRLWEVMDNLQAKGADIPYDYFRRGCAKSVVQVIHRALGTSAIHYAPWSDKYTKQTQRELVRNFIEGAPWEEFFMYFLIGVDGDKKYPCEQKLIVPTDLVEVWQQATFDNGASVLDDNPRVLLEATRHNEGTWFTPLLAAILLLIFSFFRFGDYIVLTAATVAGAVMTYLIVFSGLPCTSWNWLIIPFNILPILAWHWRRYWALPYAILVFVWCLVMTGEWFFGHIIVDWPHILFALSFAIVLLKNSTFFARKLAYIKKSSTSAAKFM